MHRDERSHSIATGRSRASCRLFLEIISSMDLCSYLPTALHSSCHPLSLSLPTYSGQPYFRFHLAAASMIQL